MFKQPTTIVVGAGASVEYGLPSGQDIFRDFVEYFRQFRAKNFIDQESNFYKVLRTSGEDHSHIQKTLLDISQRVEFQFNTSIDEYLYDNSFANHAGKIFSCYCILKSIFNEYEKKKFLQNNHHLKNFVSISKSPTKSWLASLTRHLAEDCQNVEDLKKNKLTIITYNYDLFVEQAILALLKNTERFSQIESLDFLPIYHVNGKFEYDHKYSNIMSYGGRMYENHDWFKMIADNASNIFMINEQVDGATQLARKQSRKAINNSEKVYFIGFAFDPRNLSTIGYASNNISLLYKNSFGLNYDGNISLQKRMIEIGINKSDINGTTSKPMGCSEAAELGFFVQ